MSFSRIATALGGNTQFMVKTNLPFTAGATGRFRVLQTSSNIKALDLLKGSWGLHGTSIKSMGDQLKTGEFEVRNGKSSRIYVDNDVSTVVRYALRAAAFNKNDTPIVLAIQSDQQKKSNRLALDGHGFTGKGFYQYFDSGEASVKIRAVYLLEEIEQPKS